MISSVEGSSSSAAALPSTLPSALPLARERRAQGCGTYDGEAARVCTAARIVVGAKACGRGQRTTRRAFQAMARQE